MTLRRSPLCLILLLCFSATPAPAEEVVETWRSLSRTHMGNTIADVRDGPDKHSLDPQDCSMWWIEVANVVHLSADGTLLFRSEPLATPCRVAVDPANGSCWVLQDLSDELLHFGADGRLLSATPGQYGEGGAALLTPSPADGSVWIRGESSVVHVDAAGGEAFRRTLSPWEDFLQVVVDPMDGSAWMTTPTEVIRLRADGGEMWRVSDLLAPTAVDEDPRDQSLWVAVYDSSAGSYLIHIASDGTVLSELAMQPASALCVSPTDGSVWLQHSSGGWLVVHRDSSGSELWRLDEAALVAHNDLDGSVWLASSLDRLAEGANLVHYSADHEELRRLARNFDIDGNHVRAHDPTDNSLWVSASVVGITWLKHRSADGTVLSDRRLEGGLDKQRCLSLDRRDGSCWVTDRDTEEYVRLSPEGVELERWQPPLENFHSLEFLRISPFDGSWWVLAREMVDGEGSLVRLHLTEDGTEMSWADVEWFDGISYSDGAIWYSDSSSWTDMYGHVCTASVLRRYAADGTFLCESEGFNWDLHIHAFAPDGSAWVEDLRKLVRFAPSGAVVAEIPLTEEFWSVRSMDVFPHDGSIYGVGVRPYGYATPPSDSACGVFRMTSDGTLMWVIDGLPDPGPIVVDPANGSAWVAVNGRQGSAVIHLAADGTELWRGETFNEPESFELDPRDGSLWLDDSGNYQLVHLDVIGDERPRFIDVPTIHWSYDEIEACADAGIVGGYDDGLYHPEYPVSRDQMAVFISRALVGATVPAGPEEPTFDDVPTGHWAYKYVEYCVITGVVQGFDPVTYGPTITVSRDAMAVFISRAVAGGDDNVPVGPAEATFDDVPTDHWAYKYVEYCAANDIVQGYDPVTYGPTVTVSRDQMAVFISRAFDLL